MRPTLEIDQLQSLHGQNVLSIFLFYRERERKAVKKQANKAVNGGPISKIDEIKLSLKYGGNTQVLLQNVNTAADLTDKKRVRSNVDLPTYLKENEKVIL